MGKAPKLLNILVTDRALFNTPEVTKLREQGHRVELLQAGADGILGPHCWRMRASMVKYLTLAVRAMREEKYAK